MLQIIQKVNNNTYFSKHNKSKTQIKQMQQQLHQKVSKIQGFLPPNRDIFAAFAEFQSTQQLSEALKFKYFDENLNEIAKMMAASVYKNKETEDIDEVDMIGDLEEWLSSGGIKFRIKLKQQPKTQKLQKIEKKHQIPKRPQQTLVAQQNVQPKFDRSHYQGQNVQSLTDQQYQQQMNQIMYQQQTHQQQQSYQQQQQLRPQAYYQTQPQQGRQNQIKYNHKQPESGSQNIPQAPIKEGIKRVPYEKQTLIWIQSLSKCLNYPQKRYIFLPEMHPKRKF